MSSIHTHLTGCTFVKGLLHVLAYSTNRKHMPKNHTHKMLTAQSGTYRVDRNLNLKLVKLSMCAGVPR